MKVMIDTNIIISAALFKSHAIKELMNNIFDNHTLVLTNSIIDEVKGVVSYKFPHKVDETDAFFASISFEYQHTPTNDDEEQIKIRDDSDRKIIASAKMAQVDVLITGDKDFFDRTYDGIEILTPAGFMKKYNGVII